MKFVDVYRLNADKIAEALGRIPTWSDFDVRGEIGYAPYYIYCCCTDEPECREDTHEDNVPDRLLREAETIYEEMVKKEYHKMYKNPAKIPNCTGIIQRDRATIVTWDDNTKTTIVAEKGFDENEHMLFDAFCIAFTKKMLGSTTNILKTIEANDTDTINKRKKEFEEQIKKTMREANEQQEKARFEAAVQAKMYEDRVIEEAIHRIRIRNERKMNNDETREC